MDINEDLYKEYIINAVRDLQDKRFIKILFLFIKSEEKRSAQA